MLASRCKLLFSPFHHEFKLRATTLQLAYRPFSKKRQLGPEEIARRRRAIRIGLMLWSLVLYSLYRSKKKVTDSPKLELVSHNHCYSPFLLSSIFSIIYPRVSLQYKSEPSPFLPFFLIFMPPFPYIDNSKLYKRREKSLELNENIGIRQKVWFDDSEDFTWDEYYADFFGNSVLHNFNIESTKTFIYFNF